MTRTACSDRRRPAGAAGALGCRKRPWRGGLPVQVVSCGVPFSSSRSRTRRAVDNAVAAEVSTPFGAAGATRRAYSCFSHERGAQATVYSRMFAPELGVAEDPATGSASGPLGCYLVRHKVVAPAGAGAILNLQGVKMGRPSHVHVSIGVEKDDITSVRVGGEAVLAGEGTLYV